MKLPLFGLFRLTEKAVSKTQMNHEWSGFVYCKNHYFQTDPIFPLEDLDKERENSPSTLTIAFLPENQTQWLNSIWMTVKPHLIFVSWQSQKNSCVVCSESIKCMILLSSPSCLTVLTRSIQTQTDSVSNSNYSLSLSFSSSSSTPPCPLPLLSLPLLLSPPFPPS